MTQLGERHSRVLASVVTQYIATGEPVGSRTIARSSGLNLSPASIRNLMLDLEEGGYLSQPHTSAGRLPTALGFRYYVDRIMPVAELGPSMRRQIEEAFTLNAEPQELFRQASRVLSTMSGHTAMVLAPRPQGMLLKHIQFIDVGGDGVLAVLVSQDNQVQTRFVRLAVKYSQEQLDRFSQYLNGLCQNLTLAESRRQVLARMEEEKNLFDKIVSQALSLSRQVLQNNETAEELYIEGTSQILDYPEFSADVAKIRALFKAFEEKHHLITLLDQTLASQGVQIIISPDEHFPEMQLSVVASSYSCHQAPIGSLGIIGPMRMDYARVIPIVRYTASTVTGLLRKWQA